MEQTKKLFKIDNYCNEEIGKKSQFEGCTHLNKRLYNFDEVRQLKSTITYTWV